MTKEKTHSESDFLKINHAKTTAKIDINQLGISLFQELNKIYNILNYKDCEKIQFFKYK